jgi:xanthine dehydrogenase accessory factor
MRSIIYLRGGGDLATGIGLRLHRAGLAVMVAELPEPLVVRRKAAFAEAVFAGQTEVEGVAALRVDDLPSAWSAVQAGLIPVLVDPFAAVLPDLRREAEALILIDGRMTKRPPEPDLLTAVDLMIGLGPGFTAGLDCHAVIETNRGHRLGRVIWSGSAQVDTGLPESVNGQIGSRVLRAPCTGVLTGRAEIGDLVRPGQILAEVSGVPVVAPFAGALRGLLHSGLRVAAGMKIGDLDPRNDPAYSRLVSDKSLAVGGGVLEAILAKPELRRRLW